MSAFQPSPDSHSRGEHGHAAAARSRGIRRRPEREAEPDIAADIAAISRIEAVPTILKVVAEVTGLRLALVARVTQNTWTACAVLDRMNFGLDVGDKLEVATTLCSEVRDSHEPIIVEHASVEPDYRTHPTPKLYGFESYIAVPIFRPGGEYFGNVCALDSEPAVLRDQKTLGMMQLFAELIALQLVAEEESVRVRAALSDAHEVAQLREQFIAVLGHDLRNPLFSILSNSGFLLMLPSEPAQRPVIERIRRSGERMSQLINDIMDFTRVRLGGGMELTRREVDVAAVVRDVIDEIASIHPKHRISADTDAAGTAWLDQARITQMLSNLVGNAVEHSTPDEVVDVWVEPAGDRMVFGVTSRGSPISPDVLPRLFQPYVRGAASGKRTGLGLGLYIASEIARAHGGTIGVDSTLEGVTTFRVELPRGSKPQGETAAE